MKLWLISQDAITGWDTYDSAVVIAETADDAKMIHPSGEDYDDGVLWPVITGRLEFVSAALIGTTELVPADAKSRVVCASFNAAG